jgi:hypothetical protein
LKHTKDFCEKMTLIIHQRLPHKKEEERTARFLQQVAKCIKWILILFLFSYLVYSQVWLNLLVGDLQFG